MSAVLDVSSAPTTFNSTLSSAVNVKFETISIPTANCTLFCRSVGTGKALVVVNGGPGLTQDYLLEFAELAKSHQVIFFDQRGCGQSPCAIDDENMQMKRCVDDLEILRKALDLDTISIVGHSWGGLVAMRYAIEHEKCVEKLILLNPLPAVHEYKPSNPDLYMDGIRKIHDSDAFKKGDAKGIAEGYRDLFRPFFFDPKKADKLNLSMTEKAAVNSILIRETFETNFFRKSYDYKDELEKLNTETLIVCGENDKLPVSIAENLHSLLPRSKKPVAIKDCGHFPHVEQPELLFKELTDFLLKKP